MSDSLFKIDSDIFVITGVSGQLGCEYTKAILKRGARIIGLDIEPSLQLNNITSAYQEQFKFCPCDVTQISDLKNALVMTRKHYGEPSVVINNAAIDSPPDASLEENGPFESYPDSSWDRVMDVNVKGVYLTCKVFGAALAANNRGSIINISSIYGLLSPDQSIYEYRRRRGEIFYKPIAYSASKSALLNLTRYLAVYWAKAGVRVNTLVIAGVENNQEQEFMEAYCNRIPIGRMANRDEYVGAVIFLASEASKYMTGAELIVDGGWTAI